MKTKELYSIFIEKPLVSTDTRNIKPDSLFFALKGVNFDANLFAADALKAGAKYAVVDNPEVVKNDRYIFVNDVLSALQQLASFHRNRLGLPVIAITGTNGKTTTKELTAAVLSKKYKIVYTKGNLNNHIGVPLTLLAIDKNTEIAIIEMGANHPGEIKTLCEIANPDFGLITNIGKAHLEGFGSFEGVVKTKTELYDYLNNKNGKIFINADNQALTKNANPPLNKIEYGWSDSHFLKGEIVSQTPYLNVRAWFPKGLVYLNSQLIGAYNFENILAAACIGKYFEVDPIRIQEAIGDYQPENNRSQLVKRGNNTIIMDAYNANPTSMAASIQNFLSLPGEDKCVILGDMLELGKSSADEHQTIVDMIRSAGKLSKKILVGSQFSATKYPESFLTFKNSDELLVYLAEHPIHKSLILIKGSRGMKLEKILDNF